MNGLDGSQSGTLAGLAAMLAVTAAITAAGTRQLTARIGLYALQALCISVAVALDGSARGATYMVGVAVVNFVLKGVVGSRALLRLHSSATAAAPQSLVTLLVAVAIAGSAMRAAHGLGFGNLGGPILALVLLGIYLVAVPGDQPGQLLGLLTVDSGLLLAAELRLPDASVGLWLGVLFDVFIAALLIFAIGSNRPQRVTDAVTTEGTA